MKTLEALSTPCPVAVLTPGADLGWAVVSPHHPHPGASLSVLCSTRGAETRRLTAQPFLRESHRKTQLTRSPYSDLQTLTFAQCADLVPALGARRASGPWSEGWGGLLRGLC